MKSVLTGGTCTAAVLAFSMAAFAQSGQTGTQTGTQTAPGQMHGQMHDEQGQMTLTGCVVREADYRAAKDQGRGGVAGTGAGVGNEFVLVNATMSHGKTAGAASGTATGTATGTTAGTTTGTTTGSTTGTTSTAGQTTGTSGSGMAMMGDAYELTGQAEGELATYVGRRVEITGRLKSAEGGASGKTGTTTGATTGTATGTTTGTGTATAAGRTQTGGGVDIMGQDLNLREFEVMSVKAAEGTCPPLPARK